MSVVAAYVYENGRRVREVVLDGTQCPVMAKGEFLWLGLVDATPEELEALRTCFGLHPLALANAQKPNVLPRIETYDDEIFVIARTVQLDGAAITYGRTAIFVGERHVITLRSDSARSHAGLREELEASPSFLKHGVDSVLYGVLDFIVDGYLETLDALEEDVLAMERRALDAFLSRTEIARIFDLRRQLVRFGRIIGPMEEVANRLGHVPVTTIDPDIRPYFRDLVSQVDRVARRLDGLREILSFVLEASSLLEQQRQSEITRQLAAWAAILAVPTAVAGIYGMNFEHMPELQWTFGYPAVLCLIFGVAGTLFWRFKRAGWL
ncbi:MULTISPECIES: magnesium and cobalt transport protein CorA [unclassified Aureimonas]|uniref:magnesium and cobalt transport protein CorA n=1 Tax=unclassified Aureimonas TaxID=2615206 RepID=UPI0007002FEA|nr:MULTISPECIES: magnesium and cobalt transport protein CorA [unclassified Aureimonas]KQT66131.1 magnesium transporter [Aureimonas sp. Leaf427]KQT81005.1 magnesium transporter [Aureimonas sp. Leaf460]